MSAVLASSSVPPAAKQVTVARAVARTCAAEWTRLWTVKSTWWCLTAATFIIVGMGVIAGFGASSNPTSSQQDAAWEIVYVTAVPAQFALLALALIAVTADYATSGIVPTLQWTPRRSVLFFARVLVPVVTATAVGVMLATCSAVAAYLAAAPTLALPLDEGLDALGTVALVFASGSCIAVGLGFVLRSTAGALITLFPLMLVLPLVLPVFGYDWMTTLSQQLPGAGALFLLTQEIPEEMTKTSSVVVLVTWAIALLALGWLRLVRDDANR